MHWLIHSLIRLNGCNNYCYCKCVLRDLLHSLFISCFHTRAIKRRSRERERKKEEEREEYFSRDEMKRIQDPFRALCISPSPSLSPPSYSCLSLVLDHCSSSSLQSDRGVERFHTNVKEDETRDTHTWITITFNQTWWVDESFGNSFLLSKTEVLLN